MLSLGHSLATTISIGLESVQLGKNRYRCLLECGAKDPQPRYPRVWKTKKKIGTISKSLKLVECPSALYSTAEERRRSRHRRWMIRHSSALCSLFQPIIDNKPYFSPLLSIPDSQFLATPGQIHRRDDVHDHPRATTPDTSGPMVRMLSLGHSLATTISIGLESVQVGKNRYPCLVECSAKDPPPRYPRVWKSKKKIGIIPKSLKLVECAPVGHETSPSAQPTVGAAPIYGIAQFSPSPTAYTGPYISIGNSSSSHVEHALPERPGLPECQYYLKTGDCKFGSTCKYHHPREWSAPITKSSLGPMGLPLRPGASICSHYAQSGVCRYGPSCRFDHPMGTLSYSPSASSLTDMPVAPYPVGSTNMTLAPSSSSSDLRPELLSGPSKDTFLSQMSSTDSSSTSVGLIFSKSGPAPQSSIQHSRQGSSS